MKFPILLFALLVDIVNSQSRFATECTTPNFDRGLCIQIQDCARLYDNIVNDRTETFEFIRTSACGPSNQNISTPKVCCGKYDNFVTPTTAANPSVQETSRPSLSNPSATSTSPPRADGILPKICGRQKLFFPNRIIGGTNASVGEFPWLARLVHYNKYNRMELGCAGFLIHQKFVLTAAHCLLGTLIEHLGKVQQVLLGVHNDTKARVCDEQMCSDPPKSYDTLDPIIHKEYDSRNHKNDIALIPLKIRVDFTDFIKPICISRVSTNTAEFTVSGWGQTETDARSKTKLKVELPRYDKSRCVMKYRTLGLPVTDNQICAGGEEGRDSCTGDSGGPLMAVSSDETIWYAEGIVSFGNHCGRKDWPAVYTYIPKYYDWIVKNIKDNLRLRNKGR